MVVVDHVTSQSAVVFPIAAIASLCRERGLRLLVDGAHAPGMLPLDLGAIGSTWYVGNCHKWLCAPKGSAFLWANPDDPRSRLDLHPPVISHFRGAPFPAEFDWIGTRDHSSWLAVPEALAFHRELGPPRVRRHNAELALVGARVIAEALGEDLAAPASMLGSMVAVPIPWGGDLTEAAGVAFRTALWREERIEVAVYPFGGRMRMRVSAHVYNEPGEYVRLAAAARARLLP